MKKIVYTIADNGIDGREPTKITYASFNESERDTLFDADKNKAWLSKGESIIDVYLQRKKTLAKLNPIDLLVLFSSKTAEDAEKV
jgi:hypothetical protein